MELMCSKIVLRLFSIPSRILCRVVFCFVILSRSPVECDLTLNCNHHGQYHPNHLLNLSVSAQQETYRVHRLTRTLTSQTTVNWTRTTNYQAAHWPTTRTTSICNWPQACHHLSGLLITHQPSLPGNHKRTAALLNLPSPRSRPSLHRSWWSRTRTRTGLYRRNTRNFYRATGWIHLWLSRITRAKINPRKLT